MVVTDGGGGGGGGGGGDSDGGTLPCLRCGRRTDAVRPLQERT
jgi:hypothetical protein